MSETPFGDEALDLKRSAEYCGYAPSTLLSNWREWGLEPTKIGGKNYWFKTDLDKWMAGRIPEKYGTGVRWRQPYPWGKQA